MCNDDIKKLEEFLKKEYSEEIGYLGTKTIIEKVIFLLKKDKTNLYQYLNYERYKAVQNRGNHKKIKRISVIEKDIIFLSEYIKKHIKNPVFGLCHGTRRGKEQEWFSKYLNCPVLGTEIADTANQFKNTIEWDFHEIKDEWIEAVDFIYSNAFDHSYDPEKCINAWMSCLKKRGICILEWRSSYDYITSNELDPFGACITVMPYLILKWGRGEYAVVDVLNSPSYSKYKNKLKYFKYLIIKKR